MISTYSAEFKALSPQQKAKVRRALKAYEAERNPIMYETNRLDEELRREAYKALNCAQRVQDMRAEYEPQIEATRKQIEALNERLNILTQERYDKEISITSEPYAVAHQDVRAKTMHEVWKSINARHEAKMKELLESFKIETVA